MESVVEAADLGRDHAVHDQFRRLEHGHRAAPRPGGGGGFEANVAAADDHQTGALREPRAKDKGIFHVAQIMDAGKRRAGNGEPADPCPRGQQQLVIGQGLAGR